MSDLDVLQRGLWACSTVLQAALVLRIVEKNLLFGLRWFVAWLPAEVAFTILLIWTPLGSGLYLHAWNVSQPILCVLRIAAGWEVIRRTMNVRLGKRFTRYHALGALAVLLSLALGAASLRFEKTILQCSPWIYGIVFANRAVWTSIATVVASLLLVPSLRPPWSLDRNTAVHAILMSGLASVEACRYLVVAYGHGAIVNANIAAQLLEILLFATWIACLRPESEIVQV
jgi:hypothetical protein